MEEMTAKIQQEMNQVLDGFRDQSVYWALHDDSGMVEMIEDDIRYNQTLLDEFIEDQDLGKLRTAIYQQDTAPREDFYRVLNWIDDHLGG